MVKISFVGDMMCEKPFLAAAKTKKSYDFSKSFESISKMLKKSTFVVGGLETPIAGKKAGYTKSMFSFNTPEQFAVDLKRAGVDVMLTANNHCTDRGIKGLNRTINTLNRLGIKNTGVYSKKEDFKPVVLTAENTKITVISCTDSTNANLTRVYPSTNNVNLLSKQVPPKTNNVKSKIKRAIKNAIGADVIVHIKRFLHMSPRVIYYDNDYDKSTIDICLKRIKKQIDCAKKHSDIVVVCPHMGGQFNPYPGRKSEYIMEQLCSYNPDLVISSHPHVVQKIDCINGVSCAFSLGNFSMSMSTKYILKDNYPEIGMIYHVYIENKRIVKTTFSLVSIIEDINKYIYVLPLDEYYESLDNKKRKDLLKKVQGVVNRVYGKDSMISKIPKEFSIPCDY